MANNGVTATFVRDLDGWRGTAKLWRVSPPVKYGYASESNTAEPTTEYVVTSAVNAPYSGPETYIFACDERGDVLSWGELDGSYRGGLDHERAIKDAGMTIATAEVI